MFGGLSLSTPVLLGALALNGTPAAAAEMTVGVGGYIAFQAGFFDDDRDDGSNRDLRNETEIHVRADGRADNGLQYGARVELQATTDDGLDTDESLLYVAGTWGRVELGDEDGAADSLTVFAPTVGIGQHDGDFDDWIPETEVAFEPFDTDDSTKVSYYTPRIAGVQFGASWAPELNSEGEDVVLVDTFTADRPDNTQQDMIELGLNYETQFRGFGVLVGGAWVFGNAKDGSDREDTNAWSIGTQVSYAGFTVGGGWVDNGESDLPLAADGDVTSWNIGLAYENGPVGVATSYVSTERDGTGLFDTDLYSLGATYAVAPGLSVSADGAYFDTGDSPTGEGYLLIVESRITF